jgi:hypothetical protein
MMERQVGTVTTSFVDHYQSELRVYWGTINGVPVYAPLGTSAITIPSEWLAANPPKKQR